MTWFFARGAVGFLWCVGEGLCPSRGRGRTPPLRKRYKRCGAVRNPPVTASPCQPPLGKGAEGTGDADCHSQCAHWLRNDTVFARSAMGGRPQGSPLRKRNMECGEAGRCGERTERCRWQKKRSERVAAVKILSVRRKAAQKFWAPQQDHRPLQRGYKGCGTAGRCIGIGSYGSVSWCAHRLRKDSYKMQEVGVCRGGKSPR